MQSIYNPARLHMQLMLSIPGNLHFFKFIILSLAPLSWSAIHVFRLTGLELPLIDAQQMPDYFKINKYFHILNGYFQKKLVLFSRLVLITYWWSSRSPREIPNSYYLKLSYVWIVWSSFLHFPSFFYCYPFLLFLNSL